MRAQSSKRACACCFQAGNNCTRIISVSNEDILSSLAVCYPSANLRYNVDVYKKCISTAYNLALKSKFNSNDQKNNKAFELNSDLSPQSFGNYNFFLKMNLLSKNFIL